MASYYVNKNTHEVHNGELRCPAPQTKYENRAWLGNHTDDYSAVKEAVRSGYTNANGCYYCARRAHTD